MNKFLILFFSLFLFGCGPSLVTTGAKTVIGQNQDEKSFGQSWDDAAIKLGIKEKYFSYDEKRGHYKQWYKRISLLTPKSEQSKNQRINKTK